MSDDPNKSTKDKLIDGAEEVAQEAAKKIPGWAWAIALIAIVGFAGFYFVADKLIAYQESTAKNSARVLTLMSDHEHCQASLAELQAWKARAESRIAILEAKQTAQTQ